MIDNPRDPRPTGLLCRAKFAQVRYHLVTRSPRRSDGLDQRPVGVPLPIRGHTNPFEKHSRDLLSKQKIARSILRFKRGKF
jgi:hypothetical protein